MAKNQKIAERAKARKEAEDIAKAKKELQAKQQQQAETPPAEPEPVPASTTAEEWNDNEEAPEPGTVEPELSDEHHQALTIFHPLQQSPGVNQAGKPINKRGTKGLYTDEICLTVEKLAEQGCTDEQIAKAIGIGKRTFYEWLNRHPHFSHAINKYRGLANMYVENALFRSALGYNYTEEQLSKDGFAVECKKHMTGSVAAQKYYLNNRMPDRYKNKVETVMSLGENISSMGIAIKRRED